MSLDFLQQIGAELLQLSNSPFFKVGEGMKRKSTKTLFLFIFYSSLYSSQQLCTARPTAINDMSWNPSRLFRPSQMANEPKSYKEIHIQEEEKQQTVRFELFKNSLNENYQQEILKLQAASNLPKYDNSTVNIGKDFGIKRLGCLNCQKCSSYQANFTQQDSNVDQSHNHQQISCFDCSCPMNSHIPYTPPNPFRKQVWQQLASHSLQDCQIDFPFTVLILQADLNSLSILNSFATTIGFWPKEFIRLSAIKTQLLLLRTQILMLSTAESANAVEQALELLISIEKMGTRDWNQLAGAIDKRYHNALEILQKVKGSLPQINFNKQYLIVRLRTVEINTPSELSSYAEMNGLKVVKTISTKYQALLCTQLAFPLSFTVDICAYFLPSMNSQSKSSAEASSKMDNANIVADSFRDLLDSNSMAVILSQLQNVSRPVVEKALTRFLPSTTVNFILGAEVVSEFIKCLNLFVVLKTPSQNIMALNNSNLAYLRIQQEAVEVLMRDLTPSLILSQRCVILIRPSVIHYAEAVVNLLRLNDFILIKRIRRQLSREQAAYFRIVEGIAAENQEIYTDFMTTGQLEIILVSRPAAIYVAHILADGCLTGMRNYPSAGMLKVEPSIVVRKQGVDFSHHLNLAQPTPSQDSCRGIRDIFSIGGFLFGSNGRSSTATRLSDQNIVINESQPSIEPLMKCSAKSKAAILQSLHFDQFNPWIMTSKSDSATEEIAGLLLPQCCQFEPSLVFLKPGCSHLLRQVRQKLTELRFFICLEKTVVLSRNTSAELLLSLQKVRLSTQQLRQLSELYSTESIHLMCLSKVGARAQIKSLLNYFQFFPPRNLTSLGGRLKYLGLKDVLVPVWKSEQMFYKILSPSLTNMELAITKLTLPDELSKQQAMAVFSFLVGSCFGTKVENANLQTSLGKLQYKIINESEAILTSWYYSQIARIHPIYVPLLYQFRKFGEATISLHSHCGEEFVTVALKQFAAEKEALKSANQAKQKSLVVFLWARKIAQMITDVSALTTNMKDYGPIVVKDQSAYGTLTARAAADRDKDTLLECAKRFSGNRDISKNINRALNSRLLQLRYQAANKRVLPSFGEVPLEEMLYALETSDVSLLHLVDQYTVIDPQNQQGQKSHLYALKIDRVKPQIMPRHCLAAEVYTSLLRWAAEASAEYKEMFASLVTELFGQLKHFKQPQLLEFQIYLSLAKAVTAGAGWAIHELRIYPDLAIQDKISADSNVQKVRNFLPVQNYFKATQPAIDEIVEKRNKELRRFVPEKYEQPRQKNAIYNPNDTFQRQLLSQQDEPINLLRNDNGQVPSIGGIYVEYGVSAQGNDDQLKNIVAGQLNKFETAKEDQIVYQNGLENKLWYRRSSKPLLRDVKGQGDNAAQQEQDLKASESLLSGGGSSKLSEAVQKQVEKFNQFKLSIKPT